jgi:hypothetical protein
MLLKKEINPMATAAIEQPKAIPINPPVTQKRVAPLKIAFFGEQGTGKTFSAALLAAAVSKQFHDGAPVWSTDPERGWQFPKHIVFGPEKIELVQRTVPTFAAMMQDMRDAERAGACVYVVELSKIWMELLATCRRKAGNNWGNELVTLWNQYVNFFLNTRMHCFAMGRVGDVTEEVEVPVGDKGATELKRVKTGEKMKAGGSSNFGYEPHLVLRMSLEIKPRTRKGQTYEDEGRMVHRAHVLKDRTTILNGKMLRWSDQAGYKEGGYRCVWQSIAPHFQLLQQIEGVPLIDTHATSDTLINDDGKSEWYERKERKEILSAELHGTMDMLWGGGAVTAKQMRMKVFEHVFGFKSKEAADAASLEKIERGVRILQAFEKRCRREEQAKNDLLSKGELEVLAQLDIDIREFDEHVAEESELPF